MMFFGNRKTNERPPQEHYQTDEFDEDLDRFRRPVRSYPYRHDHYPVQDPECLWNWNNSPRSIHGSSDEMEDDIRNSWDDELGPLQPAGQIQPYQMGGHMPNAFIHEPGFQVISPHSPRQMQPEFVQVAMNPYMPYGFNPAAEPSRTIKSDMSWKKFILILAVILSINWQLGLYASENLPNLREDFNAALTRYQSPQKLGDDGFLISDVDLVHRPRHGRQHKTSVSIDGAGKASAQETRPFVRSRELMHEHTKHVVQYGDEETATGSLISDISLEGERDFVNDDGTSIVEQSQDGPSEDTSMEPFDGLTMSPCRAEGPVPKKVQEGILQCLGTKRPLTIVTAASELDFRYLVEFVKSFTKLEQPARLVLYDLGLSAEHFEVVQAWLQKMSWEVDHELGPKCNALLGSQGIIRYLSMGAEQEDAEALQKAESWKPRIMYEVAKDFGGIVLYLDVSSTFGSSLSPLMSSFESNGVTMLSPTLSSEISRWLPRASMSALSPTWIKSRFSPVRHSDATEAMIISSIPLVLESLEDSNIPLLSTSIVALDAENCPLVEKVLEPWSSCAMSRECYAPLRNSWQNSNNGEAIFSLVAHASGLEKSFNRPDMQSLQQSFNILPSTYEDEKLELLDSEKMKCGTHGDDLTLTIVTAASSDKNYFNEALATIDSVAANDTAARIVFFDLGLTLDQSETMQKKLSSIQGDSSFTRAEYRHFIYGDDADLFKNLAKFAWKPAIMGSVMEECGGPVLWLDAGNIVHQYLKEVRFIIQHSSFLSVNTAGTIDQWTYPGTIQYLTKLSEAPHDFGGKSLAEMPNLSGSIIGFDADNRNVISDVFDRWYKCCHNPKCLAPKGSNKKNHRFDQAVLSIVATQAGIGGKMPSKGELGISVHGKL